MKWRKQGASGRKGIEESEKIRSPEEKKAKKDVIFKEVS